MSDKCSFYGNPKDRKENRIRENTIAPPKTPYEILMEKRTRDKTHWFIDEKCEECGKDIYTDGKLFYCKESCIQNGKRGKTDPDRMGFITDYF